MSERSAGAGLPCVPGLSRVHVTHARRRCRLPGPVDGPCELCGSPLVRHRPFGRFISCSRRPMHVLQPSRGDCVPRLRLGEIADPPNRGKSTAQRTRIHVRGVGSPARAPCRVAEPRSCREETKKGLTLRCLKCKSSFDPDRSVRAALTHSERARRDPPRVSPPPRPSPRIERVLDLRRRSPARSPAVARARGFVPTAPRVGSCPRVVANLLDAHAELFAPVFLRNARAHWTAWRRFSITAAPRHPRQVRRACLRFRAAAAPSSHAAFDRARRRTRS